MQEKRKAKMLADEKLRLTRELEEVFRQSNEKTLEIVELTAKNKEYFDTNQKLLTKIHSADFHGKIVTEHIRVD